MFKTDNYLIFVLPEQLIQAGKGEALRIRAILRSLVPIEDLVGVISLSLQIPAFGKGEEDVNVKFSLWYVSNNYYLVFCL